MSISAAVEELAKAVSSIFNWASTAVENQTTTDVVKGKRDLKKAIRYAEQAFDIVDKFGSISPEKERKRYETLVKKFRKWE